MSDGMALKESFASGRINELFTELVKEIAKYDDRVSYVLAIEASFYEAGNGMCMGVVAAGAMAKETGCSKEMSIALIGASKLSSDAKKHQARGSN